MHDREITMQEKIKIIFRNLLKGVMTLDVMGEERRYSLDGGGFRQDRENMRSDVCKVARDMRIAVHRIRERQTI